MTVRSFVSRGVMQLAALIGPGLLTVLPCVSMAQTSRYEVVALATLTQGTSVVVRGPNLAGTAVGGGRLEAPTNGLREGLIFERGAPQAVQGRPGSDYTNVLGANDVGAVVGAANSATSVRAFVGQRGAATRELPPLPGDTASAAFAINNAGQAAGWSSGASGERATIWLPDGVPAALLGGVGRSGRAYAINQQGAVAGVIGTSASRRASLWLPAGSASELLPLQGFAASEATWLNARRDVVGYSATPDEVRRATLWPAGGAPIDLGTLAGGVWSQAFGNNDGGVVVGACDSPAGARACLWSGDGSAKDLNGFVTAPGLVLTKAVGINNAGHIVALGHESDGHEHSHDHEQPIRVVLLIP